MNTRPAVMEVGGATTVATIARIAAAKKIALDGQPGALKEGDRIEWEEATLKGRITIDTGILDAAVNELIR